LSGGNWVDLQPMNDIMNIVNINTGNFIDLN